MIRIAAFLLLLSPFVFADAKIETITVKIVQNGCNVMISGSGDLKSNGIFLDNPPRVVLDFPKTKCSAKSPATPDNPYLKDIRVADNKDACRIVAELKSALNFSVATEAKGISLRLSPRPPDAPAAAVPAPQTENATLDLVIGAEDVLDITVFELPQFSGTVQVSGDGTITMPLIGSVEVDGMTKKEVETKIASSLEAQYINNPKVSVNIKEYRSRQVSILGAVGNPGSFTIISSRNLLQLLSEAGGLSATAGPKCFIFRKGSSKIEIDLHDLVDNGNQKLNIQIMPGDVINIPVEQKIVIYVLGAVRSPGAVEMSSSMPVTLLAAIARAGGPSDQANKSNIQIRRHDESGQEKVIKANLKDILSGKAPDVQLLPGDVINVPESFF